MTGSVFIWHVNVLERIVNAHTGPIFSMFTSSNCLITGAKEKYKFICLINNYILFLHASLFRPSSGSTQLRAPIKIWDYDMQNGRPINLKPPDNHPICVRSVCRNTKVKFLIDNW